MIRMLCDGVKIEGSGDYLMLYRIHGGSITANSAEKQKREVILSERYFYRKCSVKCRSGGKNFI